jgi:uncharacterized membrane protein YphA (DoxX/SURF4 family)
MKLPSLPHNKRLPTLLLRAGLSIVFLYAAISSFVTPSDWIGFLPPFLTDHIAGETLLRFFSVYEIALVAWLVSGIYVRWAALLCALTLAGIIVSNIHQFPITFRDLALVFAALALAASDA